MDITADLDAPCSPADLFSWVESLDSYDRWLGIVPVTSPAEAHPDDQGPAWFVTLRGKVGPLARSKRLRMVRTEHDVPNQVSFERREHDGRDHASWVLRATVAANGDRATLKMELHYGGTLWVPLLDRVLKGEIEQSRQRLRALVASDDAP